MVAHYPRESAEKKCMESSFCNVSESLIQGFQLPYLPGQLAGLWVKSKTYKRQRQFTETAATQARALPTKTGVPFLLLKQTNKSREQHNYQLPFWEHLTSYFQSLQQPSCSVSGACFSVVSVPAGHWRSAFITLLLMSDGAGPPLHYPVLSQKEYLLEVLGLSEVFIYRT